MAGGRGSGVRDMRLGRMGRRMSGKGDEGTETEERGNRACFVLEEGVA